ncbi:hypothetical protein [Frigidibacter sp. MR17.24]|uniref:hypothetical protein n=1 Tax=Frigidibacter sp. MR17.24 TaxID=3127345 RepID=UPI003012CE8A
MPDDATIRYVVTCSDLAAARRAAGSLGIAIDDEMGALGLLTVRATARLAARLAASPGVEAVEPEGMMRTQ